MLEEYSKFKVKQLITLTDQELIAEKVKAEKQWNYIQTVNLAPVKASAMMGKMEWYIGRVMEVMTERDIKEVVKPRLRRVCKHTRINGLEIPLI